MDKQVPEGTLRFEVEGVPTTPQDFRVLSWVFSNAVLFADAALDDTPEDVREANDIRWVQPYGQGGGYITLERRSLAEILADEDDAETWAFRVEREGAYVREENYTGWWFTDYYTDSMTGIYSSPVFTHEGSFALWDY